MTNPKDATRRKLLDTAYEMFADRGFYGVSIANIAAEIGVTKQALLHHFGSKEKLYGEVLAKRSEALMQVIQIEPDTPAAERLNASLAKFYTHVMEHQGDARIVMRELLDNSERAANARKWYLKDFLETLTEHASHDPRWHGCDPAQTLAGVYKLVGAINYFAVSRPTLDGIFGKELVDALEQVFPDEVKSVS